MSRPKVGALFPDTSTTELRDHHARFDYCVMKTEQLADIAPMKTVRADMLALWGYAAACEVEVDDLDSESVPWGYIMSQVGTTLSTTVTSGATSIPVTTLTSGGALFAVGDPVVCDGELMTVTGIDATETPTLADSYAVENRDDYYRLDDSGEAGHYRRVGQSFTAIDGSLASAKFFLRKFGSPTGNATATLYEHTGVFGTSSEPVHYSDPLATSAVFDVSTLTTDYALTDLIFDGTVYLAADTNYVVCLEYEGGDVDNHVRVGVDVSSPSHGGNGVVRTSQWVPDAGTDVIFEVYINVLSDCELTVTRAAAYTATAHASGTRIAAAAYSFSGTVRMDMTDQCPVVDGKTWVQWRTDWLLAKVADATWDGIYVDLCGSYQAHIVGVTNPTRSIDYLRDNTVTADAYAAFDAAWNVGQEAFDTLMRAGLGSRVYFTNEFLDDYSLRNGTIFEGFPYMRGVEDGWVWDWVTTMFGPRYEGYGDRIGSVAEWVAGCATPNLTTLLSEETTAGVVEYSTARYTVCSALLAGAYSCYGVPGSGYQTTPWLDEYDVDIGDATADAAQVDSSGVYRRDYTNGIVLVNPTAAPVTVNLGGTYHHFVGAQAPTLNDGSPVSSVTIPSHDGVILLAVVWGQRSTGGGTWGQHGTSSATWGQRSTISATWQET